MFLAHVCMNAVEILSHSRSSIVYHPLLFLFSFLYFASPVYRRNGFSNQIGCR